MILNHFFPRPIKLFLCIGLFLCLSLLSTYAQAQTNGFGRTTPKQSREQMKRIEHKRFLQRKAQMKQRMQHRAAKNQLRLQQRKKRHNKFLGDYNDKIKRHEDHVKALAEAEEKQQEEEGLVQSESQQRIQRNKAILEGRVPSEAEDDPDYLEYAQRKAQLLGNINR